MHFLKSRNFKYVFGIGQSRVDPLEWSSISAYFKKIKPDYVFLMHFKSGGILANLNFPAEMIYENLQIQNNIIHASFVSKVKKLLFLASSCAYPKDCPQPIKEGCILTGELEKTSEPYALAKISGIKMCQSYNQQYGTVFISAIPATEYGPGDNFDQNVSHVLPALLRKFHDAKKGDKREVEVWGSGRARREFIYVDDLVQACLFLMDNYEDSQVINIGSGQDISIKELANLIKEVTGFKGKIIFDNSKPDGAYRKLLDDSKITKLGYRAKTLLEKGLQLTYAWYKKTRNKME
jgi:GDP-L-fucose synthase